METNGVELPVTWRRTLSVWWALAWRSMLAVPLGALVGCAIGFVLGALGGVLRLPQAQVIFVIQCVTFPAGFVLGLMVGLWATNVVLRKRFKEFRVALIAVER